MDFIDYPWVWPPPGFARFDLNGSQPVLANSSAVVLSYQIPILQDGWITLAGIELSSYSPTTYFQLLQAGTPIRDYEKVQVPLGAPNTPASLHIHLQPNQIFSLSVVNGTGNNLAARWRFYGWYFPQKVGGM